jgi:copper homeostasis protein
MSSSVLLEVATDSIAGCRAAEEGGAQRIELCAGLVEGGTTPSLATVGRALACTRLPVMVMLRPRGGDFLYDAYEYAIVRRDLELVKAAGAKGVVLGLLDVEGGVDVERMRELLALARPMQLTFHRAFDLSRDLDASLEALIALGVDRVLTSGGAPSAAEGAETIARLVERAGSRIVILPGGGIRPENAAALVRTTRARELHFSARRGEASPVRFHRESLRLGAERIPAENERLVPDLERIRAMARLFAAADRSDPQTP